MWVDGKEIKGEIIEAAKAREVYTSIVRRTQDPGLLEYLGNNLAPAARPSRSRPTATRKSASASTAWRPTRTASVEYVYPLKTDGKAAATLEEFSITATIKSQHGVANVYSPTHAITLKRTNDKEVTVNFDKNQELLDKDFQLFYSTGDKDVGLTALTHRPISTARRLLHHAHHAQGGDPVGVSGAARHGAGARHLRQYARRQDGAGPQGHEVLSGEPRSQGPLRLHQLRHHGQPVSRTSLLDATSEQIDRGQEVGAKAGGHRRHRHQRRPGRRP